MAQWSGAGFALTEDGSVIPTTIPGGSQPPVTSAPRAPMLLASPTPVPTHVHLNKDR